jgi:MoaA/NifB/PqqE/SkfB family radical SAM enzyme
MGTTDIILTGEGEPLLHPRFDEVVTEIKRSGFCLTLITNGTLFTASNVRHMIENELDIIKVSLWAGNPEQYRAAYPNREPESFQTVVDGLELIRRLKQETGSAHPRIFIHYVINRSNASDLGSVVDLAIASGCDGVNFAPFKAWRGLPTDQALKSEEFEPVVQEMSAAAARLERAGMDHNVDAATVRYQVGECVWQEIPCYLAWFHARVKLDGKISPCDPCDRAVGDLDAQSFQEIWNGEPYREFRRTALTLEGLAEMSEACDCIFCCHLFHNWQIHQKFRPLRPVARMLWRPPPEVQADAGPNAEDARRS